MMAHPVHRPPGRASAPREVIVTVLRTQLVRARALFARDDEQDGQGLAEYALILALIAIIAIIALIFLGNQVSTILSTVGNSI